MNQRFKYKKTVFTFLALSAITFNSYANVCSDAPVPAGSVVIKRYTQAGKCPQTAGKMKLIALPNQTSTSICAEDHNVSNLPAGFVITDKIVSGQDCKYSRLDKNESRIWIIQRPIASLSVCSDSPIPAGFSKTGEYGNPGRCSWQGSKRIKQEVVKSYYLTMVTTQAPRPTPAPIPVPTPVPIPAPQNNLMSIITVMNFLLNDD
jgi:hypothetical protein